MYVYAVESLQKQWYTGVKHINIKSRDSKGIISLWQSPEAEPLVGCGATPCGFLWDAVPHSARAFSPWKSFY